MVESVHEAKRHLNEAKNHRQVDLWQQAIEAGRAVQQTSEARQIEQENAVNKPRQPRA